MSGDVESTEPTKMLMRIADHVDNGSPVVREWFLSSHQKILDMLAEEVDREKYQEKKYSNSKALEWLVSVHLMFAPVMFTTVSIVHVSLALSVLNHDTELFSSFSHAESIFSCHIM